MDFNHEEVMAVKKNIRAEQDRQYKASSKDRLRKISTQKIRTTMIGALSEVEKHFGFLWGLDENGRPLDRPLTKEELEKKEIFEKLRSAILDNGNNQIRNLETELQQYEVEWLRFTMQLPVKPEGPNGRS